MTFDETLAYLDTTSRVSCPSITCEQAAEIAALIRDAQDDVQWAEKAGSFNIAIAEQELQAACGFAWDAGLQLASWQRGWESKKSHEQAREAATLKYYNCYGRQESDGKCSDMELVDKCGICQVSELHKQLGIAKYWMGKFDFERNEACGFAWDCGREMALKDDLLEDSRDRLERAHRRTLAVANTGKLDPRDSPCRLGCDICRPVEATGDIDPGMYEGTGKGFEK